MKMDHSLGESGLLIKCVSETIKNETKDWKGGVLSAFLGTWGASLLGNILTDKGVKFKIPGQGVIKAGEGTIIAGQDFDAASSFN